MRNSTPLLALRNLLITQGLDGMIIPRTNAHQSEDCTLHDDKLAWLTDLNDSAGFASILWDRVLMFANGRYQIRIHSEVSLNDFGIHHLHDKSLTDYLRSHIAAGKHVGLESVLVVSSQFEALSATHYELVPLEQGPFGQVQLNRPAMPCGIVREMPIETSEGNSTQKCARVAKQLAQHQIDVLATILPDNIVWLLNVYDSGLAMMPVLFSLVLLHRSGRLE